MHHKLESTLKRSFRSIDLRYFVGYMFLDEISKEYSAIYGQLANVQEYIYPAAQGPIPFKIRVPFKIRDSNDERQR